MSTEYGTYIAYANINKCENRWYFWQSNNYKLFFGILFCHSVLSPHSLRKSQIWIIHSWTGNSCILFLCRTFFLIIQFYQRQFQWLFANLLKEFFFEQNSRLQCFCRWSYCIYVVCYTHTDDIPTCWWYAHFGFKKIFSDDLRMFPSQKHHLFVCCWFAAVILFSPSFITMFRKKIQSKKNLLRKEGFS